jgi:urea transport system ATP-binding protein
MLEVEKVDLHYGAAIALRQVSIQVTAGAVTCVLGRNGVGKTSMLRAIVGAHPISAGSIKWEGEEISRLPMYERARRGIAWVPQGRDVFPLLTVRENLETGFAVLPRTERKVPAEIFDLFPVLKTMLGRRGGDLSGGQQQQLSIARALVMKPRLIVLDEPTEGIQPSIIKDIGRVIALLRSRGDMGILLVEQYFDFAQELAQTMVVMDRGDVVLSGRREDLDEADVRRRLSV